MSGTTQQPDLWKEDIVAGEGLKELTTLNLGPTHPATHGIFQNVLTMDGEIILSTEQTIGYIHRAFEKICERRPFYQITTLTDRMNYCSAPINNMGWHMAVEKLLGIDLPKRVEYMRVIIMELSRITDHIICNTIISQDSGATTPFLYVYQWREKIYEIYEEICGARLTTNMGRIGGFERNFSELAWQRIRGIVKDLPAVLDEFDALLVRNRIFMDRTINCGPIGAERALEYGFTGPNLRAAGVDYDVRVADPYSSYQDFDFAIPVGKSGDVYDRFTVRQEEMRQSISIIRQALERLDKIHDKATFRADVPDWVLPPKEEVYNDMEALIFHFKAVMGEVEVPVGEIYHCVEGGNGELGFYIVSDGGRTPFRVHLRRPCFIYYQAYPEIIKGGMLSDAILTMSSMNVIAGELDA
ncbi:MAG: NADH-quinone oxidoreductase subunit D [Flavobacteriales bacterium]|nr:NADH-quinone oxidoreductase subunit D [Flavobacteriales bacterium]MBP9078732.1 NADH-quinone oxidoreductase subunit D [Flavobacteriales bacterium]